MIKSILAIACLITATLVNPQSVTDVTGTWKFNVVLDAGSGNPTFTFEQEGENLTGVYRGAVGEAQLLGTVEGDEIEFTFVIQGAKVTYTGTVTGDTMEGTCDYGGVASGTFTGTRVPSEE